MFFPLNSGVSVCAYSRRSKAALKEDVFRGESFPLAAEDQNRSDLNIDLFDGGKMVVEWIPTFEDSRRKLRQPFYDNRVQVMQLLQNESCFTNPLDRHLAQICGATALTELPDRLRTAQLKALNQILRHVAAHSTFYARLLSGCDLRMDKIEDLSRLPCTTAADLRLWQDFCCVSQSEIKRVISLHTSGTTGLPKRLAFTEKDLERTRTFFRVGMSQLVKSRQRLAVLLPGAERPDGVADLLRQALSADGVHVAGLPAELGRQRKANGILAWLSEFRPHVLVAAPAQLEALLHLFPDAPPPEIEGVLSSSDWLDPVLNQHLRAAWNCELLDHYGLTESGFGCAVECPAHDGYHLRALDVFLEVIDPQTGLSVPPGQPGEIVLTTLNREAMPLIRYRTGDVAVLLTSPCRCGSPLPRLGPLLGRLDQQKDGQTVIFHPVKGQSNSQINVLSPVASDRE